MKCLVMIPAYNEEASICKVIEKLEKDCPQADYLVINDCSKDGTEECLLKMGAAFVSLPLNLGIGGAVQTGYQYARDHGYDIAVQIDGDGQHDTAYLKRVIEPIEQGKADVVIGSRFLTGEGFQSSGIRRMGIRFLSTLIKLCTGEIVYDVTSGFRAVSKEMIALYADDYPYDYPEPEAIVMASMEGMRIQEIPVIMVERQAGTSSISPAKSIYYMMKVSIAVILCRCLRKKHKRGQESCQKH